MKKIVITSTVGLIYDGITNVIVSYLEAMDLQDLDIYIVATIKAEPTIIEKLEKLGCHIVHLPSRREDTLKYFLRLISFIKKNKIEVIHAHGNSATLAIEMVAGWIGGCKKRIAHSHNTRCNQVKADKLLRPVFNCCYTDALACGVNAGKWLFKNRKFTVLQNGRNVEKYVYNEQIRNKLRTQYNIHKELVIGHVGGFFEQKNHKFLLIILHEILKIEPQAHFFLIGDGPLKKKIEYQARDLNEHITFTGTTDRVTDYLQMMDGMLLPSLFEGLPLVAIEWQINGLPCILSDTITKDCVFMDNVRFKSLNDSAKEWAQNIIQMIRDNDRINSSINAQKKIVQVGFDIKQGAKQLRSIYIENE